jgi:ABC-type Fe3+-hydroxamate transport system substrate-binding protein
MKSFLIRSTSSGVGKTIVALAIRAGVRARGLIVQSFKWGPDFIDAGHHEGRLMRTAGYILLLAASLNCFASRTLTDEMGRKVTLPDHPHRLICLLPSVVDSVYALGAGPDVVAVSDYTKYPPEAALKPSIGIPLTPSIETIVSLHPDLVLGSADTNREETVRQLEQVGITVFVVNPRGLDGILSSVTSLGKALGREEEAARLVAQLQARLDAVRARVKNEPVTRVFMPIWYNPVITIGKHAFITDIIAAAGGKSITDDLPQEWPQVSLETVIERRPEVLVLVRGSQMSLRDVENRPGWKTLSAIRNHRVCLLDERLELPSPVVFDALEDLTRQLHP